MKNKKILFYTVAFLNILMFVYYFVLAYFNRFSQDDYLFFVTIKKYGILDFVKGAYLTHSGRYSYYLHEAFLYYSFSKGMPLWMNQFLIYSSGILILFFLMKRYFSNSYLSLNLALFIVNTLVLVNFEFSSFYWSCATVYYLMAICPVLLYLIISSNRNGFFTYITLIILSLWVGGLSEALVPVVLVLFATYFFFILRRYSFDIIKTLQLSETRKLLLSIFILLFGFLIIYIAPGNSIRMKEFHQTIEIFPLMKISIRSVLICLYLLAFKIPYLIPLLAVFAYLGVVSGKKTILRLNFKSLVLYLFLLIVFIWINVLPPAYAMSSFGYHRIYSHTILFILLFCICLSYSFGALLGQRFEKKITSFTLLSILLLSVSILFHFKNDIPTAQKYSRDIDNRNNYLIDLQSKGQRSVVELDSLSHPVRTSFKYNVLSLLNKKNNPVPVLYYLNEVSADTLGYNNMALKNYLQLNYFIKIKE